LSFACPSEALAKEGQLSIDLGAAPTELIILIIILFYQAVAPMELLTFSGLFPTRALIDIS
jgi:hypothetical protein